jgi:hypothetical protein
MKRFLLVLSVLGISLFQFSCKDKGGEEASCDSIVISSENLFTNAERDHVFIDEVKLNGDCLEFTYSSSGCDSKSWIVKLIDSETILESDPPQRNLLLSFKNDEKCLAYFTENMSFDISNLKIKGENKIILNIENSNKTITYQY